MTNFEPAPWPADISDYFAENEAIAEVPAFLHPLIAEYAETLASVDPNIRFKDIRVKFGGTVLVYLENEDSYDERIQEPLEYMMKELTNAYIIAARNEGRS